MSAPSIRDMLYEPPGPKARRRIRVFTALSLLALAALLLKRLREIAAQLPALNADRDRHRHQEQSR